MKQFFYAVLLLGFLAVSCTKEDLVAPSDNSSQLSENDSLLSIPLQFKGMQVMEIQRRLVLGFQAHMGMKIPHLKLLM